jgi:hypothetical protein
LYEVVGKKEPRYVAQAEHFSRSLGRILRESRNANRAHRLFELATCGYSFTTEERQAIDASFRSDLENHQRADSHACAAAAYLTDLARSVLMVDVERGVKLSDEAARHTARVPDGGSRLALQRDILKVLLGRGDMALWRHAVKLSLEFDVAIVQMFDGFARMLLQTATSNDELPQRLLERIMWAEQLIAHLTRSAAQL